MKTPYIFLLRVLVVLSLALTRDAWATDFYVSPTGVSSGSGTITAPWSITYAFTCPSLVKAGDTINIRAGTYTGDFSITCSGTSSAPITIRSYPGELAKLDGSIRFNSSNYTTLYGVEVVDSLKMSRSDPFDTINGGNMGVAVVNSLLHDACICLGGGMFEAYGNIMWNCGKNGREHGVYWQNDFTQTHVRKLVQDNIIFNSSGFGIHSYSSAGQLNGLTFDGNVLWQNGVLAGSLKDDILLGGGQPVNNADIKNNIIYGSTRGIRVGWSNLQNTSVNIDNNYIAIKTSPFVINAPFSTSLRFSNNTIVQQSGNLAEFSFPAGAFNFSGNTYFTTGGTGKFLLNNASATFAAWQDAGYDTTASGSIYANNTTPQANKVFIKPNKRDPKRTDVVIFNWTGATSIAVDMSSALIPNHRYEIRAVENYFVPVDANKLYSGGTLTFNFPTSPSALPKPLGTGLITPSSTFPNFGVFTLYDLGADTTTPPPGAPSNLRVVNDSQ